MASLSLLTTIVSGPTRDIKAFFLWRPNPLRGTIMRESTIMQETTTEALQICLLHQMEGCRAPTTARKTVLSCSEVVSMWQV